MRDAQTSNDATNTDSDVHQDFLDVQNAFKILSILGIPHVTMRIAVRCVLPRSPNQGIHRCKYRDVSLYVDRTTYVSKDDKQ